jgi:DNA repair exonuclease SbcCD ATPase subunit
VLKPIELRFSGIGPFVTEQVIEFGKLGKLVQIAGESGAGKSTAFKARDFLFGISDMPNTVLETYIEKMGISVSGDFDYDGQPLTLTRSKGKFSVTLNGEVVAGSNKLAEEKLDQIIGMPRDLFRPMLHKRQKEGGFFLNFTPKQKYEFLSSALNLGTYLEKITKIEKNLSELDKLITTTTGELTASQTGLAATQDAILSLGSAPTGETTQEAVLVLKQVSDQASEDLKALQLGQKNQLMILEQERPALQRPVLVDSPFDNSLQSILECEKTRYETEIQNINRAEIERIAGINRRIQELTIASFGLTTAKNLGATAREQAVLIAGEIKKIRAGICHTCEQTWVTEAARAKEADQMSKLSILKGQIEAAVLAASQLETNDAEMAAEKEKLKPWVNPALEALKANVLVANESLRELQDKLSAHQATQSQLNKKTMDDYHEQLNTLNKAFAAKEAALRESLSAGIDLAQTKANDSRRSFEFALNQFQSFNESKKRFESSSEKLKAQELAYAEKVSSLNLKLSGLKKKQMIDEEIKRAVKAYVSTKFDDALDSIGDAATNMIRPIPNMTTATIQLQGTRETADGKIKDEVNAVIHKSGFENIPIKSLSGGERSAADFALDLAVIEFLEERTSKGISLMMMDEPFTGLPTTAIEQALEMLQNYKCDKQIVLIDHNPIIEQFIQSKITVTKNEPSSVISLI